MLALLRKYIIASYVAVEYSLRNSGRSYGNWSIVGWAAPNIVEIVIIVIAPK